MNPFIGRVKRSSDDVGDKHVCGAGYQSTAPEIDEYYQGLPFSNP